MAPRRAVATPLHVAESPASYARRAPLVVDATVLAAQIFAEETQAIASATLQARALHAPWLVDFEMASVAQKKVRRERRPVEAVQEALRLYAALPLERHAVDLPAVLTLAEQCGLTTYDAAYLWLASHLGAPLATFDRQLAEASHLHLASGPGTAT
jgi:predicted nucleic acid-binding protein